MGMISDGWMKNYIDTILYRNSRNISSANHHEKHIFQKSLHLVIILHPDAETENRPSPKKIQKLCEKSIKNSQFFKPCSQIERILYKISAILPQRKESINMAQLKKLANFEGVRGPVLTIVMDGVGIAPATAGNAVYHAYTPTLDMLMAK